MNVHKLLIGDGAAQYLPFALSRLRALEAIHKGGFFSQTYTVGDATINVRQDGKHKYVRIVAGGAFYMEFATSAHPVVTSTVTVDGTSYPSYKGCVVGVGFSGGKTTAAIRKQFRSENSAQLSKINRPYQVQIVDEPVNYPQGRRGASRWQYPTMLFGTYAPGHSHTGIVKRTTTGPSSTFVATASPGPLGSYTFRDIDLDVPFFRGQGTTPIKVAYIRGAADWPRKSGMQVVKSSQWGTREYAIYLDAFNQFSVFPTNRINALDPVNPYNQNVDELYVRRVTPSFPAWVYTPASPAKDYWASNPNLDQWTIDQPELDWRFNHLGTKCCAVAYTREPYNNDTAYWTTDQNPDTPWNGTKFDAYAALLGVEFTAQEIDATSYQPQRYFVAPGVIEATIDIQITGANDEDFTATVNIASVRDPTTDYAMPVFAGYTWHDIPGGGQKGTVKTGQLVEAGQLVIAYLEYWVQPKGSDGTASERTNIWSIRKNEGNVELMSFQNFPILAVDFQTLSFVFMVQQYRKETRNVSLRSGAPGAPATNPKLFSVREFAAWIVTLGTSREFLYPTSLSLDARARLQALTATSGRAYVDALIAAQGSDPWQLISMSSPKDGWVDSGYNNYRDWWGYQNHYAVLDYFVAIDADYAFYGDHVQYKLSGSPPSLNAAGQAAQKELNALDGSHQWLLFCDSPRWNWHAYQTILQRVMYKHPHNTFFAHPNGSYAFWDAGWIYDDNGIIGNAGLGYGDTGGVDGTEWHYNTLNPYDTSKIEHVIFDTVRLKASTSSLTTSFLALYNKAVVAGKAAGTLEAGIDEVAYIDMKATFVKETANNGNYDFLDLHATWKGVDWWFGDQGVTGESWYSFPYFAGTAGNLYGLNFWQYWRITNFAGGNTSRVPGFPNPSDLATWGYRFANVLIIDDKG